MRKLALCLAMLLLAGTMGCSENPLDEGPGDNPNPPADSTAVAWFQALADTMQNIGEALDQNDPDFDYVKGVSFADIRDGFEGVLDGEPGHGLSHLGLSLVEFVELNYDADLWQLVDTLDAMDGDDEDLLRGNPLSNRLIGRQYQILAESPFWLFGLSRSWPDNLTVPALQELIHSSVLPKVDAAIEHVEEAEADADLYEVFWMDDEEAELDLGEVYFYDASLRALRAGLRIMTAYSMDIAGPDGDYDWLEELDEDDVSYEYVVTPGPPATGDTLRIWTIWPPDNEMLLFQMLQEQLQPGTDFLTLNDDDWSGQTQLDLARVDLLAMLAKADAAITFIESETDDQDLDIIKLGEIQEINGDISDCDDCPNFAQDWETIHDVIDWVESVLSGPIHLLEEDDHGDPIDITVDISVLFDDPIEDWKDMLPLHDWLPENEWVQEEINFWWSMWWDHNNPYYHRDQIFTNIGWIEHWERESYVEPLEFVDGMGDEIDPGDVLPHFPDYTMGGLFPLMDRDDWIDLLYD